MQVLNITKLFFLNICSLITTTRNKGEIEILIHFVYFRENQDRKVMWGTLDLKV